MQPFSMEWQQIIDRNVPVYARLGEAEQRKLRCDVQVFVAEKHWEGCGGLVMTDEIKVTIAALACFLVLAFENEYFDLVQSILVYPDAYVAPGKTITRSGVVLEGDSHRGGEAWYRGPVILSWADALAGARQHAGGNNVVLHEFAHQLDMQNGSQVDGVPVLSSVGEFERWQRVVGDEFVQLEHACQHGQPTLLDCYGTTNMAEFFAVATECFFERSLEMARWHPALYDILQGYYRQDPAKRIAGWE